jgi:hypothetical protein
LAQEELALSAQLEKKVLIVFCSLQQQLCLVLVEARMFHLKMEDLDQVLKLNRQWDLALLDRGIMEQMAHCLTNVVEEEVLQSLECPAIAQQREEMGQLGLTGLPGLVEAVEVELPHRIHLLLLVDLEGQAVAGEEEIQTLHHHTHLKAAP